MSVARDNKSFGPHLIEGPIWDLRQSVDLNYLVMRLRLQDIKVMGRPR